jgi:branched-chain amino acid transport system substrate-binding protein
MMISRKKNHKREGKMKKLLFSLTGFFLIFVAFLGASQAAPKEFIVGCNFVLSGPGADGGIAVQRAAERAAEIINKEGFTVQGEKITVKPVYYDSKYVPAESVLNLEKMLSGGIKFIYSMGSGVTVPLVEKTTAAKVFMMASCSGSGHLTNAKYPLSFRIYPTNEAAFAIYPWLAKQYPQIKKVAHINPSDEAGYTESETRTRCSKNVGFQNVANEYFKRGATDFYPVATRVIATKPDFIDFGGTAGRDQGLLAKALREVGYKGLIAVFYSNPAVFSQIAGADNAEGALFPNSVSEPQTPGQQAAHDWYVKKYGSPVPGMYYDNADPLFMLVEAVKKANSFDPEKVAEAFRAVRWDSIFGPAYIGMESLYGIKSSLCRPIPCGIFKNGKLQHLATLPWPPDETIKKLNAN